MRRAPAMPLFRKQSAAGQTSLAPHDSKARLISVTTCRRFMAKPCTPHPHCAARAALQAANPQWRGQGAGPLAFSWGSKGDILSRERISPLSAAPHGVGKSRSLFGLLPPSAPCAEKERTSLSRSPLFLLIFCCAEAIIPLPASPSRQRQPSPVRRRNTARSARSASRTSRGTGSWSAGQWRSSSALPRGTRPR